MDHCRDILVVGEQRCGSTLLCRMLGDVGIGQPGEYFGNHWLFGGFVGSTEAFIASVREEYCVNGIFGAKLLANQLRLLYDRCEQPHATVSEMLLSLFPLVSTTYVWLQRLDILRQAVSHCRMRATGRCHHASEEGKAAGAEDIVVEATAAESWPPREHEISSIIRATLAGREFWRSYFSCVPAITVVYEEFTRDIPANFTSLVKQLGCSHLLADKPIVIPYTKTRDHETEAYIESLRTPFPHAHWEG